MVTIWLIYCKSLNKILQVENILALIVENCMSQSMMILAVDDEPLNLMILRELFEDTHEITLVESGEDAMEQLEKAVPNVILLDVMMPGIDGIEVCKRVRANNEMKNVKIIMVSGKAMQDDIQVGMDAGANHYISKPFDMMELVDLVESYSWRLNFI